MDIRLRTIIYRSRVEIERVPIYTCDECFHTEVLEGVKEELTKLICRIGCNPPKQKLDFGEYSEWAYLIAKATDRELIHVPIRSIIGERIDQLLDLLILARSLGDAEWENELIDRLGQISKPALTS
jgi:hypothetical protein